MADEQDKLIESLQKQTEALNAFTLAVMELTQIVSDMIAMGAEDNPQSLNYLDGTSVDPDRDTL